MFQLKHSQEVFHLEHFVVHKRYVQSVHSGLQGHENAGDYPSCAFWPVAFRKLPGPKVQLLSSRGPRGEPRAAERKRG